MSYRIPVSTQDPVNVKPMGNIRRTIRRVHNNVNGDLSVTFTVPMGKAWRVEGIIITENFDAAVPATVETEILYHTDAPGGSGNLISIIELPDFAELVCSVMLGIGFPYASYAYNSGAETNARMILAPLVDTILYGGYDVQVNVYDFGANDDLVVYLTYSEVNA